VLDLQDATSSAPREGHAVSSSSCSHDKISSLDCACARNVGVHIKISIGLCCRP
jgi:hypothetical protein